MAGIFGSRHASVSAWRTAAPSLLVREDAQARAVASARIAGFDMNDTLVTSKIGAPGYQVTVADWQYYNDDVAWKLRELHNEGYKIVIFTNQGNVRAALEGKRAQAVRGYVDALVGDLGVPVLVLVATQKDKFRKPQVGMWDFLRKSANGGVAVDRAASFYVGDAAGGLGEHSADDSDFAAAIGLQFHHTRDFFGPPGGSGDRALRDTTAGPSKLPRVAGDASTSEARGRLMAATEEVEEDPTARIPGSPIVLVLVGVPGSGKTTFADRLGPPAPAGPRAGAKAHGGGVQGREASLWRRVCQDLLGNKDACKRAAESCLRQGQSVIIDRTNMTVEQRAVWFMSASFFGAAVHCLVFDIPLDECCRRVARRQAHEGGLQGPGGHMVVRKLASMLEPVHALEGFSRVARVCTTEDVEREVARYSSGQPAAGGGQSAGVSAIAATSSPSPVMRLDSPAVTSPPAASAAAVAAPAAAAPSSGMKTGGAAPAASDDKVAMLAAMGFDIGACRAALRATGDDPNRAAERLLADRLLSDGED